MPKRSKPTYQELKTELDAILADLQSEELDVDGALTKYKRGLELAKQIEDYLRTAENEIRVLKTRADKR